METHIIIPIKDIEKKNNRDSYIHDEIIDRISESYIQCPECENIDDEQYSCSTCGQNPIGRINVIDWLKTQGKQISLDEKDIEEKALKAYPEKLYKFPVTAKGKEYPCNIDENYDKREGYKQALKDLNNEL